MTRETEVYQHDTATGFCSYVGRVLNELMLSRLDNALRQMEVFQELRQPRGFSPQFHNDKNLCPHFDSMGTMQKSCTIGMGSRKVVPPAEG